MAYSIVLKTPTPDVIHEYIERFGQNTGAANTEKALSRLVSVLPGNSCLEEVLLKVAAIDRLYSTNLYAIYPMAQHILALDIDSRLRAHDLELVSEIAGLKWKDASGKDQQRSFYSFAAKYCSWHVPTEYPIYDSFVDRLLRLYRQRDGFASFTNAKLSHYPTFRSVLREFQRHYGLTEFSFKEVDKFLWVYGQELFPTV